MKYDHLHPVGVHPGVEFSVTESTPLVLTVVRHLVPSVMKQSVSPSVDLSHNSQLHESPSKSFYSCESL